jgi:hypothetical protein
VVLQPTDTLHIRHRDWSRAPLYDWVGVNDGGFFVREVPASLVRWSDITVALIFRPDPFADEDFLWFVGTRSTGVLVWRNNPIFGPALEGRFAITTAPPPISWRDPRQESYVVWPLEAIGSPLDP